MVGKLRRAWPRLPLVLRADGHHSKPEVIAWLEREGLDHVIGHAPDAVLERQFGACIREARMRYEGHQKEGRPEAGARTFASGYYSAGSWAGKERRIIRRAARSGRPLHRRQLRRGRRKNVI